MNRKTAMTTGALWDAVGFQPLNQALPKLEKDGWAKVSAGDGDLSYVVLIREKNTVRLYARNSVVGMIQVGKLN